MDSLWSELTETITQSIDQASKVLGEVNQYDILNFDEMAQHQELEEKNRTEDEEDDINETYDSNNYEIEINRIESTLDVTADSEVKIFDALPKTTTRINDDSVEDLDEIKIPIHSSTSDYLPIKDPKENHSRELHSAESINNSSSAMIIAPMNHELDSRNPVIDESIDTSQLKSSLPKISRKAKKKNKNKKKQLDFFGLTTTVPEDSMNESIAIKTTTTTTSSDIHSGGNALLFSDIISHVSDDQPNSDHIIPRGNVSESNEIDSAVNQLHTSTDGPGQELLHTFNHFFHSSTPTLSREFDFFQTDRSSSSAMIEHKDDSQSSSSIYNQIGLSRYQAEVNTKTPAKSFFDNDMEEIDLIVPDQSKTLKQADLEKILYPQLHLLLPSLSTLPEPSKDHAIEINGSEIKKTDTNELHSNQSQQLLNHENHDTISIIVAILSATFMTVFALLVSLGSGLLFLCNLIRVCIS